MLLHCVALQNVGHSPQPQPGGAGKGGAHFSTLLWQKTVQSLHPPFFGGGLL